LNFSFEFLLTMVTTKSSETNMEGSNEGKSDTTAKVTSSTTAPTGTANSAPASAPAPTPTPSQPEMNVPVKTQYILTKPHATLAQPPPETDTRAKTDNNNNNEDHHPNQKQRPNRNKQNKRKMNRKKRPRDDKTAFNDKVCRSVLVGTPCPYGEDKCKYNHDIMGMVRVRQDDVTEIETGCPHYNLRGHCPFGISCRLGASHLNLATGHNLQKEDSELASPPPPPTMNSISRDVQSTLRKKTYQFACKRHFESGGSDGAKVRAGNNNSGSRTFQAPVVADAQDVTQTNPPVKKEQDAVNKVTESKTALVPLEVVAPTNAVPNDGLKDPTETTTNSSINTHPTSTTSTPSSAPIDLSPYPTKTRKLIDFSNKVYVAPLTTVGNLPFRRILKRYGADITCGEMAVARNLLEGKTGEWALLKRHPEEDVFGIQIASGHADMYTRISEVIENEGIHVDFVDLNLGCPIDVICDKGAGAKLMLRDNKLKESVQGMTSVLSCPVTIKIRTGWDENKPFAHRLVPKIQNWGIDGISAIMIHGRSRLQRYHKLADWEYIKKVANSQSPDIPRIPVIGNGDIFSYTDYERNVLDNDGLNTTAMLGRGALVKPWLPTEIKERRHWDISASERLDMLKEFVKCGLEHWGSDQQGLNSTRRFLLEWLSFLYRYIPVGLLEVVPQNMNQRPPNHMCGRNDLETLMLSKNCADWIKISEMLLGPVPEGFEFEPKHRANGYK